MKKVLAFFGFSLFVTAATAQTTPAQMGITPTTTPEVLQTLDNTKTWVPLGTVDSSTHKFSVVGGGGGGYQYQTHAALLAATTLAPSVPQSVGQQGFYAPGDGGAAIYQWSLTSYCTGGTSGAPVAADGIVCVLPIGQSASTAGRYILQLPATGIDVRQIGMVGDGVTDNYPLVATLMNIVNPTSSQTGQSDVRFPMTPGQPHTDYYFSQSFHVTRPMQIICEGAATNADAGPRMVFPAGTHGIIFDNPASAPVGAAGFSSGTMEGCGVVSKGFHEYFSVTTGSNPVLTIPEDKYFHTWDFKVGDGIIVYLYGPINGQPTIAPGATVAAVNPGAHTITPSTPVVSTYTGNGAAVWRLPVEKAFTVQTTVGSPVVTVTGGPDVLRPGDFVWSDAFPFGSVVLNASGTVGAQTVNMTNYSLNYNNQLNAGVTHPSGSPGKMWIIPSGVKAFVGTHLTRNWFGTFGIGLQRECSGWTSLGGGGCNGSMEQDNRFFFNIFGRLVQGDNAAASTSIQNVYAYESFADIVEGGAVGSTYYNENANSAEGSTALYSIVGECIGSNSSSFFGGYAPSAGGYCTNNRLDTAPTQGGVVMFYSPQAGVPLGAPQLYNGVFANRWFFGNGGGDASGSQLCMNMPDAPISWSRGNQSCGGPVTWQVKWDNRGFWNWIYYGGVSAAWMTEGALGNYTGYTAGNHAFFNFYNGFLLNDVETGASSPGPERLVDAGPTVPTATFHQLGDIHFNQRVDQGHNLAWADSFALYTPLGAAVTAGTTTTVAVGACPTPSLPAGTPILDYDVNPDLPKLLGTLASCTSSTLTFQAPATNSAASGHGIIFMQWLPAGPVAADPGGVVYPLGKAVAIGSLPACGAAVVGYATVTNGIASPTYMQAVSATGSSTRPVFCDGASWTYH